MKKLILIALSLFFVKASSAQLLLNGTSYSQNFDGLGSGLPLPAGWAGYTGATSTSLGNDLSTPPATKYFASPVSWNVTFGEFKNSASSDDFPYYHSIDSIGQKTVTNRAFAVRQVSSTSTSFPASDPGAAFVLKIDNTNGLTGFSLSFNLQSQDSTSPRATTWSVDYGFGSAPSVFTPATAVGTMTTGGNTYSNNAITVDFGSALDNQSGPVWVRIVTLSATVNAGNRPTTAIDDFNLTWTGIATGIAKVNAAQIPLTVLGIVDNNQIPVVFSTTNPGKMQASVYDLTGRKLYAETVMATNGENHLTLSPAELPAGMYLLEVRDDKNVGTAKVVVQ